MVDINCRLKVFFKNRRSSFFDISDLENLIEGNTEWMFWYWFLFLRIYAFIISF